MATNIHLETTATIVQHELDNLMAIMRATAEKTVPENNKVTTADIIVQVHECENADGKSRDKDVESQISSSPKEEVKTEAHPLTTFDPFPRLPLELRLRIWSFCLPSSVIVRVEACWSNDPKKEVFFSLVINIPGSHNIRRNRNNGLLRVCNESREAYCKQFPYAIPFTSPFDNFDGKQTQRLRLGDQDIIHIENISALYKFDPWWGILVEQEWVGIVKRLRISYCDLYKIDWELFFAAFKLLERLEIVLKKKLDSAWMDKEKEKILQAKRDSMVVVIDGIKCMEGTINLDELGV